MCAVIGCIANGGGIDQVERTLAVIFARSVERGRDGWGYRLQQEDIDHEEHHNSMYYLWHDDGFFHEPSPGTLIGNMRAEPTTEYVVDKLPADQQPYRLGKWTIVHNGTIANDKVLRTHKLPTRIDSAAIVEQLAGIESGYPDLPASAVFCEMVRRLKGSYAILATHDDEDGLIYAACNYRPIWYAHDDAGTYFASSRDYFPDDMHPLMIPPYSAWLFNKDGGFQLTSTDAQEEHKPKRALVVCSGGLDSVVAATKMLMDGHHIELVHFRYGSRAQGPEHAAILAVGNYLGVNVRFHTIDVYDPGDSPLLQADSTIAGGEAGAEFAHEWVPARNLLMLATATAMAEAGGFQLVVLGNNMEEAGAYPDNEPEFISRFNDMLPFAVGDGKQVRVVMPVGNLMKHEIVAMGLAIGAPLHLTWSCYRAGAIHCGTCGPCFMRRTAFEINNVPEVIQYSSDAGPRPSIERITS
jgi:7-cyano-7-deazaguanine synthase